ncbi:hypothetical protein [Methanobrevibacter sp.]|uniref:hypothetical protein n=1 Tax=Methanobrevibacter sp. TaxID=66852 RepID=UPI003890222E
MKINVRKTIENTVIVPDEFPFYVEELSAGDEMPTLLGLADEKYTFDEMDDEFFDFVSRKINENGIYVRLIHLVETSTEKNLITVEIESGSTRTTVKIPETALDEVTDIGIKIHGDEITIGKTSYIKKPHFEKFSKNDILAQIANEMIDDLIFYY